MRSILEFYREFWEIQLHYSSDQVLDALEWDDFIRVASFMNIRSRGTKIEKRILSRNHWDKVRGHASHGDGRRGDGTVIEIKSSIITPLPGSGVTFRGIRPWHDVQEYYFVLVDLYNFRVQPNTTVFKLSKEQILYERDKEKTLCPYTMKKADRVKNEATELGTSFKNGDLERWKEKYSTQIEL
ncbi:hypothetical protein WDW37_19040 [Bdellovibrionota bacterium FG-1]